MYNPDILCGIAPFKNVGIWQIIFTFFLLSLFVFVECETITWQTCEFWLWFGGKNCQTIRVGQEKFYKDLDHNHMCTRYMWPLLYGPLVVWATCFMTCLFYAFFALIPLAGIHHFLIYAFSFLV